MQHSNPFFNRNSIVHPRYFYNRTETVNKIQDLLYKGVCVMVSAPRRMGRSSLLRYLSECSVNSDVDHNSAFYKLFVYVDCTSCQGQSQNAFYATVLNRLRSAMLRAGLGVDTFPSFTTTTTDQFVQILGDIAETQGQIVLLLDEFDSIYNNPQLDEAFFALLRSLNTQGIVTYCNAMSSPQKSTEQVERYATTAAFNSIFIRIPLLPFAPDEARLLLDYQLKNQNLRFKPELISYLIEELAGTHPYLLHIAAYEAFEMATVSEGILSVKRLDELYQRFYEQAIHYWKSLFSELNLTEQRSLVLLNIDIQPSHEVATGLQYAGLIIYRDGMWNYISRAFKAFVRLQHVNGLIQLFLQNPDNPIQTSHLVLDQIQNCAYLNNIPISLSPLPQQLLHYLAERPNQIISIQELEMRLWPDDKYYEGADERIKPHIRLLRHTLGNPAYIQNRRGLGYVLVTS